MFNYALLRHLSKLIAAHILLCGLTPAASALPTLSFSILEILADTSRDHTTLRSASSLDVASSSVPSLSSTTTAKADHDGAAGLAVLDGGSLQGLLKGEELIVRRQSHNGLWIQTGALKIVEVQENVSLARIIQHTSATASQMFPKFPHVMASDIAAQKEVNLVSGQAVLPVMEIPYRDLFIDPNGSPKSYEFSAAGLRLLKEIAQTYGPAHVQSLVVEGYTDFRGSSEQNQVESYQRALSVKGFLVNEFGFDKHRIIAIGLGEHETDLDNFAPAVIDSHRKLIIRAQ